MLNATLYAPIAELPSAAQFSQWLDGIEVTERKKGILRRRVVGLNLVHPEVTIRVTMLPSSELQEHLEDFGGFVRAQLGDDSPEAQALLARIGDVGLTLGCGADEGAQFDGLIRQLAKQLGALMFLPEGLLDENGHTLIAMAGQADDDEEEDEGEPEPPSARRVAWRALSLCAVSYRALLENDRPDNAEDLLAALKEWVRGRDGMAELESAEEAFVFAPLGTADAQVLTNGSWRTEGLGLLAWALGKTEMLPHDQGFQPPALWEACGFLEEGEPALVEHARLRDDAELEPVFGQLLGLHWRLRDYGLRSQAMDFRQFAANCWFGTMDLTGVAIVDNDLAIDGVAVAEAPAGAVNHANSIAMERHQAANWLQGYESLYSEVDTST